MIGHMGSHEYHSDKHPLHDRIEQLERENADYKQALDELGVTPEEARRGAERSREKQARIEQLERETAQSRELLLNQAEYIRTLQDENLRLNKLVSAKTEVV